VRYGEGLHVGYRGFDAREQEVSYPFGFGLSYTTFAYGQASAELTDDGVEVRLTVTNTGERDGREVVQAYLSLPGSPIRRAPRELKAFASVPIAAGSTAPVVLHIDREDLAYWEVRLSRWVVEGGEYRIEIGASSRDLRGVTTVSVPGDHFRLPLTADSTIGEWLSDERGAELLGEVFMAMLASDDGGGTMGTLAADPAAMQMMMSFPLGRVSAFPGSPITPEAVAELVQAARS
jgi:beta-glucosidase